MTTTWSSLPHFTHYFGTSLHGAALTFYNNPNASGNLITDKTQLKIEFEQNLHSFVYTWYDSSNVNDAKWFKGDFNMNAASLCTECSGTSTIVSTPANPSTYPGLSVNDLQMQIQFDNPITGGTPARDGVLVGMQYTVTKGNSSTPTTAKITYRTTVLEDLRPQADYGTDQDNAEATCDSGGYTQTDAGDWLQDTSDSTLATNMCTESW